MPTATTPETYCDDDGIQAARLVFRRPGKVNDRVLFPLDEAVLLNRDRALKIARDQGHNSLCQWRFPSQPLLDRATVRSLRSRVTARTTETTSMTQLKTQLNRMLAPTLDQLLAGCARHDGQAR